MIYIGQPYSHTDIHVMGTRYIMGEQAMAQMLLAGEPAYSPIAMTHYASYRHNLPKESGWWRSHNYAMLRLASELRVLRMDGWHESKGLRDEIALAKHIGIPITWWDIHQGVWKRDASADRVRVFGGSEGSVQEEGA